MQQLEVSDVDLARKIRSHILDINLLADQAHKRGIDIDIESSRPCDRIARVFEAKINKTL